VDEALKTAVRDVAEIGADTDDGDDPETGLSDGEELGDDLVTTSGYKPL
jgi:hypothetical protein